jgi:hypothetical protein
MLGTLKGRTWQQRVGYGVVRGQFDATMPRLGNVVFIRVLFVFESISLLDMSSVPATDCKMVFARDGLSVQITFFETAALPLWTSGQSPVTDWP